MEYLQLDGGGFFRIGQVPVDRLDLKQILAQRQFVVLNPLLTRLPPVVMVAPKPVEIQELSGAGLETPATELEGDELLRTRQSQAVYCAIASGSHDVGDLYWWRCLPDAVARQPTFGTYPDIAVAIFDQVVDAVACQTILLQKRLYSGAVVAPDSAARPSRTRRGRVDPRACRVLCNPANASRT